MIKSLFSILIYNSNRIVQNGIKDNLESLVEYSVKDVLSRNLSVDDGKNQQKQAAQHRGGNERNPQEFDFSFEGVCRQQTDKQYRDKIDKAPYFRVPKICHLRSPFCL